MDITNKLAGMSLLDADENDTRLETLWQDRPVVLVFVRHFG